MKIKLISIYDENNVDRHLISYYLCPTQTHRDMETSNRFTEHELRSFVILLQVSIDRWYWDNQKELLVVVDDNEQTFFYTKDEVEIVKKYMNV